MENFKIMNKIFIFATVKRVIRLVVNIFQGHLDTPVLEEGKAGSSPKSCTGVLICSCFGIALSPFKIRHARIYNNGLKRNYTTAILRRGVTQVSIMNKRCGATSSPKPSDKTNDRLLKGLKYSFSLPGGKGELLFLRSLTSFSLAGIN